MLFIKYYGAGLCLSYDFSLSWHVPHIKSSVIPLGFFLLIGLILLPTGKSLSSTPVVEAAVSHTIPESSIELFATEQGEIPFDEASKKSFSKFHDWKGSLKDDQIYWGRFFMKNEQADDSEEYVLKFDLNITDLEIFILDTSANVRNYLSGFFRPVEERSYVPTVKGNFVKINLEQGEEKAIYFKAYCERIGKIPSFEVEVKSLEKFQSDLGDRRRYQALFIGFVLMMLIYNLLLTYYQTKDRAYVYFSAYLFCIAVFTAYNSGDFSDLLVPTFLSERPELILFGKLVVYLVIASYLVFLRLFLQLSELLPAWNKLFKYFTYSALVVGLIDGFFMYSTNFNYDVPDIFTVVFTLIWIAMIFAFLPALYRTKNKNGYFVIGGTLMMGIGVVITSVLRGYTVEFSTFFLKTGIILEIITFSLGLAYRRQVRVKNMQVAYFDLQKSKLMSEQEAAETERLKELDTLKAKLYTNITHEFRTPLTVIIGMNEQIEGHDREKNIIQRNSKRLLRLVNQMMELSKIESSIATIKWVHIDAVKYLEYLTESFHSLSTSKKVQLTFYSEVDEIWMDIDEEKMELLTYNLVSNAIKFTEEKGKVIFHVKQIEKEGQQYLHIRVKDNGQGIAEEELPFIFDRFYQSKNDFIGGSTTGTGIGLALVKEIVEILNGTIDVISKPGEGSSFTITLPIHRTAVKKVEPKKVDASLVNSSAELEKTSSIIDPSKKSIVIVEDNEDVAAYIHSLLSKEYNLSVCHDGEVGVEKVIELIPDLVICDVMMPKKNGYEVTRQLKSDERTSHVPVILLTAKSAQEDKLEGFESGADAFLLKPFDRKELLLRIEKLANQREQIIANFQRDPTGRMRPKGEPSLDDVFLEKLRDYIKAEMKNTKLSSNDLHGPAGLSQTQLYRKLKALTGLTPTLFIRSIRLETAKQLLQSGNFNVSEVAYSVGFKDPNYFTRVFSQEFGHSPSELLNH